MLRTLSIQNIAVAENLLVDFDAGLNIITGETGAGKSILVDALALLRGGKVDVGLIRDGSDSAQVTASFQLPKSSRVFATLEDLGIGLDADEPQVVTVRRGLSRSAKHRGYINDVPVNTRTLQQVSADLIDISSQFENQRLLDSDSHTRYLDHFTGQSDLAAQYHRGFARYLAIVREVTATLEQRDLRRRERELFEFELAQIDEANPTTEEWTQVQETLALGNKSSSARRICADMGEILSDGEINCVQLVRTCRKHAERLQRLAPGIALHVTPERLSELLALVEDVSFATQQTLSQFDIDEEKLQWAFGRAEAYNRLLQKFGPEVSNVLAHRDACREQLAQGSSLDTKVNELARQAAAQVQELVGWAAKLSEGRRKGMGGLSRAIQQELAELGMPKARFLCTLVEFDEHDEATAVPAVVEQVLDKSLRASFARLSRLGFEHARFLMSANVGLEPQPIERVASGGELSRTMLAIKSVLFEQESMSLFVFDEIDTGISGAIAAKVGRKLAEFCARRQALCITHLPQVACYARAHYVVSKEHKKNRTVARIRKASHEETLAELAGMISGEEVTPESLAHARTLVRDAQAGQGSGATSTSSATAAAAAAK